MPPSDRKRRMPPQSLGNDRVGVQGAVTAEVGGLRSGRKVDSGFAIQPIRPSRVSRSTDSGFLATARCSAAFLRAVISRRAARIRHAIPVFDRDPHAQLSSEPDTSLSARGLCRSLRKNDPPGPMGRSSG